MSFWDTVMGHNLAEVLIRNLPKIADSLNNLQKPAQRTQKAKTVDKDDLDEYLNGEFDQGRVFVSATMLDFKMVLFITE